MHSVVPLFIQCCRLLWRQDVGCWWWWWRRRWWSYLL